MFENVFYFLGGKKIALFDLPDVELCTFKKGDYIYHCGDCVNYVYYLKSGYVNREQITVNGSVATLSLKRAGRIVDSIVGLLILYAGDPNYCTTYDFIAMTDCVCYKIPAETCKAYFRENPLLLEQVVTAALHENSTIEERYINKQEASVPSILAAFILAHSIEREGEFILPKEYTNVEISKFLSVHVVTISRIFKAFRERNLIKRTSKGMLILNKKELKRYADNELELKYD